MASKTIAVIVGSLRKESINRQLARAVESLLPEGVTFTYPDIGGLGFFNQDLEADFPSEWTALKQAIETADAVLFVTPEYNRGVPGVLKNALDIASRPWGRNSFDGKPAAVIGASIGASGTSMAQAHLDNTLLCLNMRLMGQPEVYVQVKDGMFGADGGIQNADTRKFLQGFVDAFVKHIG